MERRDWNGGTVFFGTEGRSFSFHFFRERRDGLFHRKQGHRNKFLTFTATGFGMAYQQVKALRTEAFEKKGKKRK